MNPLLRLYEDILSNEAEVSLPARPRLIFVVHGSLPSKIAYCATTKAWAARLRCA